jgi:hypothetical protein
MDRPDHPLISAEAILRSRTGRSLARPDEPITAENVEEFRPTEETVAEAKRRLEKLGFIVPNSGVTLTVLGDPAHFESVLGVKLERDEQTVHPQGELMIPDSLKGFVEEIVFPEPPEFFT